MDIRVGHIRIECTDNELISLGLGIAAGKIDYEELLSWILSHET